MSIAIHTVFVAKENILFLEQWIDYHMHIGFDRFYLYDNSDVTRGTGYHIKHECFVPGKVNKYGIDYESLTNLTAEDINRILLKLSEKYKGKLFFKKWCPKDADGNILFNQVEANTDCLTWLKQDGVKWCANIDMDEFIVLKRHTTIRDYISSLDRDISCIRLSQIRFESRFLNRDKLVIEIDKCENTRLPLTHSNKNIYNVKNTTKLNVHNWTGIGNIKLTQLNDIWFNHYKLNNLEEYKTVKTINVDLVSRLKSNAKSYIPII